MAEKQYYIKVDFEFGVDDGNGNFELKNTGGVKYISMPIADAVMVESHAVIPGFQLMLERVGELGLEMIGVGSMTELMKEKNKQ
jgi:hypothetical protein